jgi:GGDEF domain-containing protein
MGEITPNTGNLPIPAEFVQHASDRLGLPDNHPVVLEHARILHELTIKDSEILELRVKLDRAQKDPLTGFWLRGPGFENVEQLMSIVENNLAGLGKELENAPNALLAIGLDVEAMHYTNNWYGQQAGDARLIYAGGELRETSNIITSSSRAIDRRAERRGEQESRLPDLHIRTGGDEFFSVYPFRETDDNTKEAVAKIITERLSRNKQKNASNLRILYKVGFFVPGTGQTPEDLYNSVDPKADMSRSEKLARPIFKIVRLGLGQYKPPLAGEL